jgi:hypothetical protein
MPSVVENAVQNVKPIVGKRLGTDAHYDAENNITVIKDSTSGRIVTIIPGEVNQGGGSQQ